MKVVKRISVVLSILLLASSLFAESIKDYVCIVKPVLSESDEKYVSDLQEELTKKGYSRYSNYIDGWKKGSFGSGFVYIGKDSKPYVVTNLHVVPHYSLANVSFENDETGERKEYKNLKVVAVSDEIDVCVLSFTEGAEDFKKGLAFAAGKLEDGMEVWSAGFPGLGAQPLWQLGKGNVTNANASIKELIDPAVSKVIQHSANVDGGNSGGPLLVANNKGGFKYQVAGVNTWKARYRDGTNFSIPSAVVKSFVDSAVAGQTLTSEKKEKVVAKIASVLEESEKETTLTGLMRYVSYDLAKKTSVASFVDVMKFGSSSVRGEVSAYFAEDPYEGMRAVAANKIISDYKKQENKDSKAYASKLDLIEENGVYRITGASEIEEKTSGKKDKKKSSSKSSKKNGGVQFNGISFDDKNYGVAAGYNKLLSASLKPEYASDYSDCPKDDGFFGDFRFNGEILSVSVGLETFELCGKKNNLPVIGAMFGLPLDFNAFMVKPFAKGCSGTNFDIFKLGAEFGCEVYFGSEDLTVRPGLGVAYAGSWLSADFDEYKMSNLKLYAVIAF